MTTRTTSLADWLLERIAEDEAVARSATAGDRTGNWWLDPDEGGVTELSCLDVQGFVTAVDVDAAHIARHDPARVLAECQAKRAIVEHEHVECAGHPGPYMPHDDYGPGYCWRADEDNAVLLALAQPYADAPGFDEAWRA